MRTDNVWRSKTGDELMAAADALADYTEDGERLIRAELRQRGLPEPPPPIGACPSCGRSIHANHPGPDCLQCGQPLPPEILGRTALEGSPADPGEKWEYRTVLMETLEPSAANFDAVALDHALNGLGDEGWQLAAVFDRQVSRDAPRQNIAIFKRFRN